MEVQSFFFLLYYSNPIIERVYIYIDGEERRTCMRHAAFISLMEATLGHEKIPSIKESLLTHGTFWILDRTANKIDRIILKGRDDIKNLQDRIQEALKKEKLRERADRDIQSGNPADKYAVGIITMPTTAEDEAVAPTITVR
jgi:hypothetical protein